MIPYRTQQALKRLAISLLVLLLVGIFVWGLWVVWLQRFVVCTRKDGAVLNFDAQAVRTDGQEAKPPENDLQVQIHYNEGDQQVNLSTDLAQITGYYVSASTLVKGPDKVWSDIQALPAGTAVMVDMKSIYGSFYYTTGTGRPQNDSVDPAEVDELIQNLRSSGYYAIARVPALRDKESGRENTRSGQPTSGGYLWMDDDGCYWLNPAKEDVVTYLIKIATELRELGFDEVVFDDYYFPKTKQIVFKKNKKEALASTAQAIVTNCATDYFAVSFVGDGSWAMPTGRTRLYVEGMDTPEDLTALAKELALPDPAIRLVCLTSNMDTRFDTYSVLRPIKLAH